MDISDPGYMVGSWMLWSIIALPTLYQILKSNIEKVDKSIVPSVILLIQMVVGGGILTAAPATRSLLLNPIPPLVLALMFYVFTYEKEKGKKNNFTKKLSENPSTLILWVAVSSFIATVGISQLLYAVSRGDFMGNSYSGFKPGTLSFNAVSFIVWAIVIVSLLWRTFHRKNKTGEDATEEGGAKKKGKDTELTDTEIEKLKDKLGISGQPFVEFLPIILKIAILAAVASLPGIQTIVKTPYSPVIIILLYLGIRYLKITDDYELATLAIVALIPQIQTLLKNPLPPVIMLAVYILLGKIGFDKKTLLTNTVIYGIFFSVIFQYIMDLIPSILSFKGLNILTGSYTYSNLSWLTWMLLILPSMFYMFQSRKEEGKRVETSRNVDLVVLLFQLVSFFILPLGFNNFRSLFINVVPLISALAIWGYSEFVRFSNEKSPTTYNFLLIIVALFSYLANNAHTMIGSPLTNILVAGGVVEPEIAVTGSNLPPNNLAPSAPSNSGGPDAGPPPNNAQGQN